MDKIAITEEQHVHDAWYAAAREMKVKDLPTFIEHLTQDYEHDYGTICHAIAAAAVAAARAVDHSECGGITGFQGGAVMWEFLTHWMNIREPARLLEMEDMLYPQMDYKFNTLSKECWEGLQQKAKELLGDNKETVADRVKARWQSVALGNIPCGYTIKD